MSSMELKCPYCSEVHDDKEIIGDWLFHTLQNDEECGHDFVCDSCAREFEVCIETTYKFSVHKMEG